MNNDKLTEELGESLNKAIEADVWTFDIASKREFEAIVEWCKKEIEKRLEKGEL